MLPMQKMHLSTIALGSLMEVSEQFLALANTNGHKRVHSLKLQFLALPKGLIGNMYGPVGKLCSLGCHKIKLSHKISFIY